MGRQIAADNDLFTPRTAQADNKDLATCAWCRTYLNGGRCKNQTTLRALSAPARPWPATGELSQSIRGTPRHEHLQSMLLKPTRGNDYERKETFKR
jgi:hypothetical protein